MQSRTIGADPARLAFFTFTATLVIQIFHEAEHVLQIAQKYFWHWRIYKGLLGIWFDFEWVHMLYNGALWLALLATWIIYQKNPGIWRTSHMGASALKFAVLFQGYHWFEHLVRMGQYWGFGQPRPKGLLGYAIPVLELHFVLGSVVTVAMLVAYLWFMPWPALGRRGRLTPVQSR